MTRDQRTRDRMVEFKIRTDGDIEAYEAFCEWREAFEDAYGIPLKQTPCKLCGSEARSMHHPNYRLPLHVIPLCEICHRDVHAKICVGYMTLMHSDGSLVVPERPWEKKRDSCRHPKKVIDEGAVVV